MTRYSISSWSLHGLLGGGMPLLDLPAQMAEHRIGTLELCHFHLPTTDDSYLAEFQAALSAADIELYSLLIDMGDITSPEPAKRAEDLAGIKRNIEVAAALGAPKVRVSAGQQAPTPEVVALSAAGLADVARFGKTVGVDVITENWQLTSLKPGPLGEILDRCDGLVGLCADTGNAEGPDKYGTLGALFPRATSVHFKARYSDDGAVDAADVERCFELSKSAGFSGPVSLIYGSTENEWAGVDRLKAALAPYI